VEEIIPPLRDVGIGTPEGRSEISTKNKTIRNTLSVLLEYVYKMNTLRLPQQRLWGLENGVQVEIAHSISE
jgi:hypothetical protein